MRGAERAMHEERGAALESPRDGVDAGRLQCLLQRGRRQDAGEPTGQHCLAGSRRAQKQHVVRACRCDLEHSLSCSLAADIVEVESVSPVRVQERQRIKASDVEGWAPCKVVDDLGKALRAQNSDARRHGGLISILGRHD